MTDPAGSGFAAQAVGTARPVETRPDVAYGPDPRQRADIYLPQGGSQDGDQRRAAVLMLHGGGWQHGDKRSFAALSRRFAGEGIVAAAINYRLAGPGARWPAQLVDARLAVRWLRSMAGDLGIDPGRICAYGDSAGGHIALFLGIAAPLAPTAFDAIHAGVPSEVACVVDNFGPTDLTVPSPIRPAVKWLFDAHDAAETERLARAASPVFQLTASMPPLMVAQGDGDDAIPAAFSDRLVEAARAKGNSVTYLPYHGGHEWKGLPPDEVARIWAMQAEFIRRGGR